MLKCKKGYRIGNIVVFLSILMRYDTIQSFQKIPPIFLHVLFYMSGIGIFFSCYQGSTNLMLLWLTVISLTAAILVTAQRPSQQTVLIVILFLIFGAFRSYQIVQHANSFPFEHTNSPTRALGVITAQSYHPDARFKHSIMIDLDTVAHQPVAHSIQVYTRIKPSVEVSDRVELHNFVIKKPKEEEFKRYLLKEGVAATLFIDQLDYSVISRPPFSLNRWLDTKRSSILEEFKGSLSGETFSLFSSLFLGYKGIPKRQKEVHQTRFKQWGISHYLARSGLHLVIIITLIEVLLCLLPFPFLLKQLFLLFAIIIYFLLTWSSISFIRALCIFCAYKISIMLRIPTHFVQVLLLCCLMILIANPLHLFFLDFQLSFGLTFAIAWLNQFKTIQPKKT